MPVDKRLDVDDDLLAHIDPSLEGRRTHMGKEHHIRERPEPRIDGRLILEDIEGCAAELTCLQRPNHGRLVNNLAPSGVHDVCVALHQLQTTRIEKVVGGGGVRTVDRYNVHP